MAEMTTAGGLPKGDGQVSEQVEENSQTSSTSSAKPDLPEGGTKGWLAVLACWCIMFNTFGYINAFGYVILFISQRYLGSDQSRC